MYLECIIMYHDLLEFEEKHLYTNSYPHHLILLLVGGIQMTHPLVGDSLVAPLEGFLAALLGVPQAGLVWIAPHRGLRRIL